MRALPEIALEVGTLFIADLHVDVERAEQVEGLLAMIARAERAPRFVILGDLFEYWLGRAHEETDGGRRILAALQARTRAGGAVDIVPGNRDFLLNASFERKTGAVVRAHGFVGVLPGGARVVCVHGDELATLDHAYQRLRRVVRSRAVTGLVPRLPLRVSRALARRLRRASTAAVAGKPKEVKALQRSAAERFLRAHDAQVIVCGHAHRFRDERLGDAGRWLVLDAFDAGPRDALVVAPRDAAQSLRVGRSDEVA